MSSFVFTAEDSRAAARGYREIANRHEAAGRARLARNFRAQAEACDARADAIEEAQR